MSKRSLKGLALLLAVLCLTFTVALTVSRPGPALAETMEQLAAEAAKGGSIIWYGSEKRDQASKIVNAFNKDFPKVPLKHLRVTGGVMAGKIIQEAQTGARTADVGSCGGGSTYNMTKRDLLAKVDWPAVGIPNKLVRGNAVITAASIYAVVYNTKLVKPSEVPRTWQDLLNPRWKGKIGCWIVGAAFVHLAKAWGEEKVTKYIEEFNKQKPFLFRSTYPLAQQVAAGEIPLALGIYHTAQPPIKAGAPVKVVVLDPTPVSSIFSFVTTPSKNKAGGKLLIKWLCSPKGAKIYEEITYRGNPLTSSTKTAQLLKGKNITEFGLDEMDVARKLMTKFNKMVRSGGVKRK